MKNSNNLKELQVNLKKLLSHLTENIDSLYKIATHDEKTGLHNYKFFLDIFNIELERAKRKPKLSLALIDIDYFKQINTKYGHIKSDKLLYKVAQILKNSLRKSDITARFGGEEFIILLPDTALEKAKKACERLRKLVEKKLEKFKVTISCGVTEYKTNDTTNKMKQRADSALYKAKNKGRNRVEVSYSQGH